MPTTVLIIGVIAALAVLLITYGLAGRQSRDVVQQRLEQLVTQPTSLEELELQQPLAERVLRPIVQRLSRIANRGDTGGVIARADAKLEKAGYPGGLRGADWMGVKLLSTIILGVGVGLLMLLVGRVQLALVFGIAGAGLGYMAPEFWLGSRARKRSWAMVLQLPDALDLLTISVEAGLGFDAALAKVVEKMEGPLVNEFRQALAEIRMGRTRRDALRDVVARADAQPISNFIGAIVQAEQLGVPIAKVLQIQSQQLRIERRQRAEEMAAKAPVKMLFPMVGCIFPTIFIVILGPAIISVMSGPGI
ncbi:MAG TPA: type II secretion system F family protein [Candidatus Limnocylindria bacterium]|jgi:tight adherence protein C|nr:type II secretion system F family protein [Candidatus Limnocylindria bacterium]